MVDKKKTNGAILEFPKRELILPEGMERVEEIKMPKDETSKMETPFPTADDVLKEAVGKFPVVLVIGLDDGGRDIDFATNVPQYTFMQWLLQKAQFELNIHERNSKKTIVDTKPENTNEH